MRDHQRNEEIGDGPLGRGRVPFGRFGTTLMGVAMIGAVLILAAGYFVDDDISVHEADVDALAAAGLTHGCAPARFCPEDPVTRAQMASFLRRALSLPATDGDYFVDDTSSIHQDDIDAIAAADVTRGCAPDRFCPDDAVTRGQMAALLARALDLAPSDTDHFSDDDGHLFESEVNRIADAGITVGCGADAFCPDRLVTRGEMASFLVRAFDLRPAGPDAIGGVLPDPDVILEPGDDVASIVSAQPPGTVFLFSAGRYPHATIAPKDFQVFIGEPGAVLDGGGRTEYAFKGFGSNVTISHLEITGYVPPIQHAPIIAKTHQGQEGGDGWVVQYCHVHHNATAGISVSDRGVMRANHVHHNGQIGIVVGWAPNGALVEDNEVHDNNYEDGDEWRDWEDGGSKFAHTDGLIVRGNYVYDNIGPGLWTDIDNINTLYENNVVIGNTRMGIYHEISYSAVIRDNIIERNGLKNDSWLWGAGIAIAASQDVEITGNYLEGNGNGVSLIQQNRGVGAFGPYLVRNVYVSGNTIVKTSSSQQSGAVQDTGSDAIFDRNNRFRNNRYVVPSLAGAFWTWEGRDLDFEGWVASGHAGESVEVVE